jgi:hypothetical protein
MYVYDTKSDLRTGVYLLLKINHWNFRDLMNFVILCRRMNAKMSVTYF